DARLAVHRDGLALLVDATALDRDRVLDGRGVGHRDRDVAGLGVERVLVELQLAARVRRELEVRGLAAAALLAATAGTLVGVRAPTAGVGRRRRRRLVVA